ncbi:hypothetical protein A8708_31945 [Paenibacillus oryzisoli]|uniref:Uncharacterized protein n=1 Tax=Paenibacillus oryzisoli TaxID=1850517 RepID=A0A198ACG7_9BACL|nr:hypothetical protein A8708_31945 [Paenibacillus oryzisoli]
MEKASKLMISLLAFCVGVGRLAGKRELTFEKAGAVDGGRPDKAPFGPYLCPRPRGYAVSARKGR